MCEQPTTIICGMKSFMRRWEASRMQNMSASAEAVTPVRQLVQDGTPRSQRFAPVRRQLCILHEDKGKRFNRCGLHAAWF